MSGQIVNINIMDVNISCTGYVTLCNTGNIRSGQVETYSHGMNAEFKWSESR